MTTGYEKERKCKGCQKDSDFCVYCTKIDNEWFDEN